MPTDQLALTECWGFQRSQPHNYTCPHNTEIPLVHYLVYAPVQQLLYSKRL